MNEIAKTLYIPLYGKSYVSKKNIILKDPTAEKIWEKEAFLLHGKSKSKWLAYNMAMRSKVFDDWTENMLKANKDALVLHIGCGLDSRCLRIKEPYLNWIDADLPKVISLRKNYFQENNTYHMIPIDVSKQEQIEKLPNSMTAIIILEGISMYLKNEQVALMFKAFEKKYSNIHIILDVYTEFGAKASKYKNPVNDVGVNKLYGIDDIQALLNDTKIKLKAELSITPDHLINELKPFEQVFFKTIFKNKIYRKIYRLYELELIL